MDETTIVITIAFVAAAIAPVYAQREDDAAALFLDLNAARLERGLRPLRLDRRLSAIAQSHARDMAARRYFDHVSPEGVTAVERLQRAHVAYRYAGENLVLVHDVATAGRVLRSSRDHLENMLEPHYARVGIAAVDSIDGELFVEDFSD